MVRKLPRDGRVVGLPSLHGFFMAEINGGYILTTETSPGMILVTSNSRSKKKGL